MYFDKLIFYHLYSYVCIFINFIISNIIYNDPPPMIIILSFIINFNIILDIFLISFLFKSGEDGRVIIFFQIF